jgi:transcriptional regulator with XRE-family HTH domain
MTESFGRIIRTERLKRHWTAAELIEKLNGVFKRAYLVKIEIRAEIPSPRLIIDLARVFDLNADRLWAQAKKEKLERFDKRLEEQYQDAKLNHI